MNENELEAMLEAGVEPPAYSAAFRDRLLRETTAQVRGRKRRRRTAWVAGCAAAYALGMFTMWVSVPFQRETPDGTPPPRLGVDPPAAEVTAPDMEAPLDPEALALALQRLPSDEQAALLKRAGDRVLMERGDVRRAAAYYKQYLDALGSADEAVSNKSETWVLAAMRTGATLGGR